MSFMCPGCGLRHVVNVDGAPGPRWSWNGSFEKPTFTPSVLVTGFKPSDDPYESDDATKDKSFTCHSFVTDGNIQYLNDCSHELAGTTVSLPGLY
ncbi:hypothetical protein CFK04_19585 [Salmonella enterica]|nr:hypothetical protein [Salmonella enterica]